MAATPSQPSATAPDVQDNTAHMDEQAHDPVHVVGSATHVLVRMADAVVNGQAHDQTFEKIKKLGQGGFGVVWLCKATGSRVRRLLVCCLTEHRGSWPLSADFIGQPRFAQVADHALVPAPSTCKVAFSAARTALDFGMQC